MPIQELTIAKASLTPLKTGEKILVHFNPASLVYSVENSIKQQSSKPKKVQYVAQLSGKLSMDLQFDTTHNGQDVREDTKKIAQLMAPSGTATAATQTADSANQSSKNPGPPPTAPPVLLFQWGSYQFRGIMDSFKETIDFFSNEGVALRALVSIQLSRQDDVFDTDTTFPSTKASTVPTSFATSVQAVATQGGDPNATRKLGSDNGLDSLRFTNGAPLQVNAGVQLNPPAAFVTASAGLGLSAGVSAGASAGLSVGAAGGISAGVSAGAGVSIGGGVSAGASLSGMAPVFGASASAGVAASSGAFSGLLTGVATTSSTANLNPLQMVASTSSADVATYNGASFNLGGAALSTGSAGLSANVGQQLDLSARLTFSTDD